MSSSTKEEGGKSLPSLLSLDIKLMYKYSSALNSVSKNKCLSFSFGFRSPIRFSFCIKLKLNGVSLRGNLSKFMPNNPTTLNGMLRIGTKEQKVMPTVENECDFLSKSKRVIKLCRNTSKLIFTLACSSNSIRFSINATNTGWSSSSFSAD